MSGLRRFGPAAALLAALLLVGAAWAAGEDTFLALQAARRVERAALPGGAGEMVLTQLAPQANAWLLLTLPTADGRGIRSLHLENADPQRQRVSLDAATPGALLITREGGPAAVAARCVLWPGPALAQAAAAKLPYAPLCDGRLFLRKAVAGNRSALEAGTEFLRDHVWRGEQIIGFVKREFYRDAFVEQAASAAAGPVAESALPGAPPPARLRSSEAPRALTAPGLGIALAPPGRALLPGRWSAAAGLDGVWVSALPPGLVVDGLDQVEAQALVYLVAFDLGQHDLGFVLGTEHPRLGWSARVRPAQRDERLPGPDGFDGAAPVVRTGMLTPALLERVVASFTGGFKREHGAFAYGALAGVNRGSHYGFVEQGVVFSRLQPGLATLFVMQDGRVEMRSWRSEDEALVPRLRHARQNGVPLVEPGVDGAPVAGALVGQWGAGNWSGSNDEQLRTLRAGACLVAHEGRRFLVYGYFSSATPRTMARVFLASGCSYAMHLDMNALEHTYLALYPRSRTQLGVEHLVPGMAVLDKSVGATLMPRFLAFADDRDFFYLLRKDRR